MSGSDRMLARLVAAVLALLLVLSTLAGTVAIMFSTFLHPFFAAGATAVVLGMPALAAYTNSSAWAHVIPVYKLIQPVLLSSFKSPGEMVWLPILLAAVEIVIFWALSAGIFSRVDIAVAVE